MKKIMIILSKIILRARSCCKLIFYKVLYGKDFNAKLKTIIYPGTHFVLEPTGKVTIKKGVFINRNCSINSHEMIEIGSNTIIGENVCIYDHNHKYSDRETIIKKQGYTTSPVIIGDNCWIGSNVTILKGVTIGNNCVVGANTLISKSIPNNTIVYNEAKLREKEII